MLRTLTRALRRDFHYSITPFAITKVGVSSMGGSIIEGKLMQEMKITDAKHKDKVIASLETDKISADALGSAPRPNEQQLTKLENDVVTRNSLSPVNDRFVSASTSKSFASDTSSASSAAAIVAFPGSSSTRTPLIRFLGKRSLIPTAPVSLPISGQSPFAALDIRQNECSLPADNVLSFDRVKRLPLNSHEIEAINCGIALL